MSGLFLPTSAILARRGRPVTLPPDAPPEILVPALGSTFHIQYTGTMDWNRNVDAYNVDAFDTSEQQVTDLKARGVYPIAYMSLGTAENWRPDYGDFDPADLGNEMDWPGEFYVDVTSANVRTIMAARLDMIAAKGFLGVDPDNVDGYYANTGFPANETVTAYRDYLLWFAGECAARGLACGLKNGQDMLNATLLDATYFHVVESCVLYTECDASSGFIDAGKPVFNIEYASEHTEPYTFLDDLSALGHQAVVKTYDLDAFSVNSWDEPSGGGEPAEGEQTVAFTADETTDFINPERGWMLRGPDTDFSGARSGDSDVPFGYAVMWTDTFGTPWNGNAGENPFRLDNYRNANLPQSLLDELDAWFTEARTRGIKLKIRFMYNYNRSDQDAPLSRMQTHIGQLAPVLNANRDVIAVMDAGFAGQYGEWHWDGSGSSYTTANFVSELPGGTGNLYFWTEPWLTAFADLTETLLTELHDDIYIGLRYPRHDNGYRLVFNGSGAWRTNWSTHDHAGNRFDGSAISRVGLYMDCLWSNQSHVGTFNYDGGQQASDIAAAEAAGTIAPVSGETCIVGGLNTYNDCSQVLGAGDADAVTLGIDMLYRKFWTGIYDKWISDGCYDQISRRLGYRIHLNSATLPASVGAGGSMTVTLNLTNTGFGKVFHARPLDLVFVGPGGPFTARMTSDARLDLPLAGETVESSFTFTAPAGLQSGQSYAVHLRLPDPDPLGNGLDDDVRYCIRLANTGIWDGTTGRHDLGASVSVPA